MDLLGEFELKYIHVDTCQVKFLQYWAVGSQQYFNWHPSNLTYISCTLYFFRCSSSTAVFGLTRERCSSLVTIGTPHISPEDALVDQTRGLLREIEETPSCSPQALTDLGIDITCVGSSGVGGNFLTTNIEELVAASSYLPLMGKLTGDMKGDGIVPLDLAFMESPARRIVVGECSLSGAPVRHAHVVPTPWNLLDGYAPSLKLPEDFVSYVSEGVLPQWSQYIR